MFLWFLAEGCLGLRGFFGWASGSGLKGLTAIRAVVSSYEVTRDTHLVGLCQKTSAGEAVATCLEIRGSRTVEGCRAIWVSVFFKGLESRVTFTSNSQPCTRAAGASHSIPKLSTTITPDPISPNFQGTVGQKGFAGVRCTCRRGLDHYSRCSTCC